MGIFSRTRDIFAANMTELLDRAEDPARMIRMIILEMEETLVEVRASAARSIADGKEMRRAISRLDELATLSSPAQDRLLRAVEYGEITRIGASKPIEVDVRIVAATNEHLPKLVEEGRFRADLLDRLSFEVVTLPPMRARKGDIPLLVEHFGRRMAVELDWPNWPGFSPRALAELEAYPRPGNVRELRNVIERAVYRAEDPEREIDAIQFDPFQSPWAQTDSEPMSAGDGRQTELPGPHTANGDLSAAFPATTDDLRGAVATYEKSLLEDALSRNRFNQRATATALGLSYDQLRHALKRHRLTDSESA